jgi:hypothetical protein
MQFAVAARRELACSSMCRVCPARLFKAPDQFVRKKVVTTTYTYDSNGNVIQVGTTTFYAYDYQNRLTQSDIRVGNATTTTT